MIVALIDNGSLEPAATINLRVVAAQLSAQTGANVQPVSWKHSDRVPAERLDGEPASTWKLWLEAQLAAGEREFLFVPFFISAQGAIGSALREDLEKLQTPTAPFTVAFASSLASTNVISKIVVARIRETIALASLVSPPVIVVDHGGPSAASAELRDRIAGEVRAHFAAVAAPVSSDPLEVAIPADADDRPAAVVAASMEGEAHAHNRPLLADQLRQPGFNSGNVVIALLFLSPGRHAGPGGDIAHICAAAEAESPGLQCHLTDLVGTHPLAIDALSEALHTALSSQSSSSPT